MLAHIGGRRRKKEERKEEKRGCMLAREPLLPLM